MTDVAEGERMILVAVDEGEESMYALSWCLKNVVAQNSKDTLILLYAKPSRAVFTSLDGTGYLFLYETWAAMEKYTADVADCVMQKAKKTCRDLRQDVKVETKVKNGDPRDVICQMAEQLRADVVVVGSHGYGGIKSFVTSILFSVIVMKLNLTTGITPSLNVYAGLLGFFFVKTWTKFLERCGLLNQPFTRQENTVIQIYVVAFSGIAFNAIQRSLLRFHEQLTFRAVKTEKKQNQKAKVERWRKII